jgi:hypothetical protein
MPAPAAQLGPVAASYARWSWLQSAAEMAALYSGAWPGEPGRAAWPGEPAPSAWPPGGGWTSAPRVATRSLGQSASSISAARAFTLLTMQRWQVIDCPDDVAAVVSELLTNALRHALPTCAGSDDSGGAGAGPAARPIRLGLLHLGPCVLCAVADPSAKAPVPRQPDWLEESGRGLQVVASLSSQWGFCIAPDLLGKVVWATFVTG